MKRFLFILLFGLTAQLVSSQDFRQAVGIRAGWSAGFEYRIYTDDFNSYRLLLSTRNRGLQMNALKEFHRYDLFSSTDQLVFVYGVGAHVGYERWDEIRHHYNTSYAYYRTAFIAGLDGLAGLEYTFYSVPISLGIEVKPYFDFFGKDFFQFNLFDFAFTARYLF